MVRAHLARRRGHVQQRHLHAAALDLQAALEHLAGVRLRVMLSSTWRGGGACAEHGKSSTDSKRSEGAQCTPHGPGAR